jgi:hypothetical protein
MLLKRDSYGENHPASLPGLDVQTGNPSASKDSLEE